MTTEADLPPEEWREYLRKGMKGADIGAWQRQLMADGHNLDPWKDDEDFGGDTHNATFAWQKDRPASGKPDGVVGPKTRAAIGNSPIVRPEPLLEECDVVQNPDAIKFVEARNYGAGGLKSSVRTPNLIVVHTMEAGEASTTAENVANWFASKQAPRASAHYCIDDDSIVQCVRDENIAWHAPGVNRRGIGIEHAGYARQNAKQWDDQFSRRMLRRSALLSATLCKRWNIPVLKLSPEELKTGAAGFCGHIDASKAFGKSDHWDPGPGFPWNHYLSMVQGALLEIE